MNFISSDWNFDTCSTDKDSKILILSRDTFGNFVWKIMMLGSIISGIGSIINNIITLLLKMFKDCSFQLKPILVASKGDLDLIILLCWGLLVLRHWESEEQICW